MTEKLQGEPYTRITCEEAHKFMEIRNSHFIDVRNDDEYESGHIPGSIHIPVDKFLQSIDQIPQKGIYILFVQLVQEVVLHVNFLHHFQLKKTDFLTYLKECQLG